MAAAGAPALAGGQTEEKMQATQSSEDETDAAAA